MIKPPPGTKLRFRGWRFDFEKRDLWVGVYWTRDAQETWHRPGIDSPVYPAFEYQLRICICLIPTLPLSLIWSNR